MRVALWMALAGALGAGCGPEWDGKDTPAGDDSGGDSGEDSGETGDPQTPLCAGASWEGDKILGSAEEMTAFCAEYTALEGDLQLVALEEEDLTALSCLRCVGGDVLVSGNPALRSLAGLNG